MSFLGIETAKHSALKPPHLLPELLEDFLVEWCFPWVLLCYLVALWGP